MKPPYKEYKIYPCDYGRVYVEAEYGKEGAPDFERTCQICLVVYDKKDLVISHDSSGVHVCRNCAAQHALHLTGGCAARKSGQVLNPPASELFRWAA